MMKKKSSVSIIIALFSIILVFLGDKQAYSEEMMLNFSLEDLSKKTITLSDYRNKQPVILFFWTTWCPHCRRELSLLNDKYKELKDTGWELLTINIGEPNKRIEDFIKNFKASFNVLLDKDSKVATSFGIIGIPTYLLINKKGEVVYRGYSFPIDKYKNLG